MTAKANKCVNADRFTRHFVLGKAAGYAKRYIAQNVNRVIKGFTPVWTYRT